MATFENDDRKVVEFSLDNKQIIMLFSCLLVICAIFFFIGLKIGEDTTKGKNVVALNPGAAQAAADMPANNPEPDTGNGGITFPIGESRGDDKIDVQADKPKNEPEPEVKREEPTSKPKTRKEEPTPKPTPKRETASQPKAGSPSAGFYVQIAAQSSRTGAERLAQKVPTSMKTAIESTLVSGKQYYRTLVGPYSSKQKAETARSSLRSSFKDAFIKQIK